MIEIGEIAMCTTSGVIGIVVKKYFPTACSEQIMVKTSDGRFYHAPASEWRAINGET